jgi:hypothetical protein
MTRKDMIEVARDDVHAAWTILENLTVSFDQIGAAFSGTKGSVHDPEQRYTLQEALVAYLSPALVQAINEARIRLGQYISDEEAEALAEHIAYWHVSTARVGRELEKSDEGENDVHDL